MIALALYGAAVALWLGHASKWKRYFPQPWPQFALAIPYACAVPLSYNHPFAIAGIVLILTTAAWLTGWGNWYDLAHAKRGKKDERTEFAVKWLYGKIPEYWYDVIGMAWRGALISLPAGIACQNPILALSGALMAPAYMIGWVIQDAAVRAKLTERRVNWTGTETYLAIKFMPRHLDGATEIGRTLSGLLLYGVLGYIVDW